MDEKDLYTVTFFGRYKIKVWILYDVLLLVVFGIQVLLMLTWGGLLEDIEAAEEIMKIRRLEGNG